MADKLGYDELLQSRVRQLKEVEDRLLTIENAGGYYGRWENAKKALVELRLDLGLMIQRAEEEHAQF